MGRITGRVSNPFVFFFFWSRVMGHSVLGHTFFLGHQDLKP
jgi:hypothetical protein